MNRKFILKESKYLSLEEFTSKYLTNDMSKFCFREHVQVVKYILEFDEELVECAGFLDLRHELKMLVSI
jgi:hypothetical protein